MRIAIVIYDKFSLSNLACVSENLRKFDDLEIKICAFKSEVKDKFGISLIPDIYSASLDGFDGVILCDGECENIVYDEIFLGWIRSGYFTKTKISFGKGGEIFARAGFENFTNLSEFNEEKIKEKLKNPSLF